MSATPRFRAAPAPQFCCRKSRTPRSSYRVAIAAVRSREPSSTTSTSEGGLSALGRSRSPQPGRAPRRRRGLRLRPRADHRAAAERSRGTPVLGLRSLRRRYRSLAGARGPQPPPAALSFRRRNMILAMALWRSASLCSCMRFVRWTRRVKSTSSTTVPANPASRARASHSRSSPKRRSCRSRPCARNTPSERRWCSAPRRRSWPQARPLGPSRAGVRPRREGTPGGRSPSPPQVAPRGGLSGGPVSRASRGRRRRGMRSSRRAPRRPRGCGPRLRPGSPGGPPGRRESAPPRLPTRRSSRRRRRSSRMP